MLKRKTRVIKVGNVKIGGGNPIAIQGMTKTDTANVSATVNQVKALKLTGADIVRIAIEDFEAAQAFKEIRKKITDVPLVADIHFDYRLALKALEYGADKIRLNPGNLDNIEQIKEVVSLAKRLKKPIRVGVNSGSALRRKSETNVSSMVKTTLIYIKMLEKLGFYDIVLSLKSSDIAETIEANKILSNRVDYPLHLGVTATGVDKEAIIKSSIGIGSLLSMGIGDTIRVSLTASPLEEIEVAKYIMQSLNLREYAYSIISCPTCGRCKVDLKMVIKKAQKILQDNELLGYNIKTKKPGKIAIMGCVVNGPGEAKEADMGIAFSKKRAVIFSKGKAVKSEERSLAERDFLNMLKRGQ